MQDQISIPLKAWSSELNGANFVVFYPRTLPSSFTLKQAVFRRENASRDKYPRSSLRYIAEDTLGRVLSIKEFFYDWAPPAYACPNLWRNPELKEVIIPKPNAYLIEGSFLWVGRNYRNRPAASIMKERTSIEITGLKGDFQIEEFMEVAQGLQIFNFDQAQVVRKKSFAELSFGYPNYAAIVDVPISFWKFPLYSGLQWQQAIPPTKCPTFLKKHVPNALNTRYFLDSIYSYQSGQTLIDKGRFELIYWNPEFYHSIHLITALKASEFSCGYPPKPDSTQLFLQDVIDIAGKKIYHAFRIDKGPHECVWQQDEWINLLLVEPKPFTTRSWLAHLLAQIVEGTGPKTRIATLNR